MNRLLKLSIAALSLAGVSRPVQAAPKAAAKETRTVEISVTEEGFVPATVALKKGEPVTLVFTRKTDRTCATSVVFDEPKVKKELPLNKPVKVAFTPTKAGDLVYGCAMGKMVGAKLHVE